MAVYSSIGEISSMVKTINSSIKCYLAGGDDVTTTITFTTSRSAGNFARILRALGQLDLKPYNGHINKSSDPQFDSIQMYLRNEQKLKSNTISQLRDMVPSIINVEVEKDEPPVQPVANTEHAPEGVGVVEEAPTEAGSETDEVAADAIVDEPEVPTFDAERIELEVQRLIQAYPADIGASVEALESMLEASERESILRQLGAKLGNHAAIQRSNSQDKTAMDSTVLKSLALQKSQFGRLSPVLAGMMSPKRRSKRNKMDVIVVEMGQFLTLSGSKKTLSVQDCPHCRSSHASQSADCHFISAFIHSFIKTLWGGKRLSVTQSTSQANGASSCNFVISGIRLR